MPRRRPPQPPLVFRVPAGQVVSCRLAARAGGKPLAAWLRDVVAWYLRERRAGRLAPPPAGPTVATISPERRVPVPKRLLDELGLRPGDRLELITEGGRLVLTPAGPPTAEEGGTP